VPAERLYVDHGLTGTRRDRPGLREALAACRTGDTLVVTKLDRLARSLPDARDIVDDLTQREVKLNLGGSVHDPTDPVGRLLFNVLAMVAEFEADLIRARTREGMQLAKAKGRLRGKQPKLTPRQEAHLVALHRTGGHTSAPSTKRRRPTPLRPLPLHLRGDPAESLRPTGRFRRSWSLRLRKTRRVDGPHVAPTGRAAEGSRGKRGFSTAVAAPRPHATALAVCALALTGCSGARYGEIARPSSGPSPADLDQVLAGQRPGADLERAA